MLSSQFSYDALSSWCRAIRHGHGAGLTLVRVFEIQTRNGPQRMREASSRILEKLKSGESLDDALRAEPDGFPELFISLAVLADRTGHIPEIFGALEEYYRLQSSVQKEFRARAFWPVAQFVGGVVVIALAILITGLLAQGNAKPTPVGFGLSGPGGAVCFVGVMFGSAAAMVLAYRGLTKASTQFTAMEATMLRMPIVGPVISAIAMTRFCMALRLTLDSSMSVFDAVKLSLRATGNRAFLSHSDQIAKRIRKGEELADAIGTCSVFPADFLATLAVGEVSGQIPEVMAKQAEYYREETVIRMKRASQYLSYGIYALVAIFLIIAIFRMASVYVDALGGAG